MKTKSSVTAFSAVKIVMNHLLVDPHTREQNQKQGSIHMSLSQNRVPKIWWLIFTSQITVATFGHTVPHFQTNPHENPGASSSSSSSPSSSPPRLMDWSSGRLLLTSSIRQVLITMAIQHAYHTSSMFCANIVGNASNPFSRFALNLPFRAYIDLISNRPICYHALHPHSSNLDFSRENGTCGFIMLYLGTRVPQSHMDYQYPIQ